MKVWGLSDRGKVRKQNQDVFLTHLDEAQALAVCVVCDGMGGARAGDVASRMAAQCFMETALSLLRPDQTAEELTTVISAAAEQANRSVWQQALDEPAYAGMGTTLVGFVLVGEEAVVSNAGDSRAYLVHKGNIRLITRDHSIVEEMVRQGNLTPEEAKHHPGRNIITRAMGTEASVESDTFPLRLKKDDCILLCSDGLSNLIPEQELLEQIQAENKENCCDRLLKLALERGAPDNVTAVLFTR